METVEIDKLTEADVTSVLFSVVVAGEKEQEANWGKFEHANVMMPEILFTPVAVTLRFAVCPALTIGATGEAVREKSANVNCSGVFTTCDPRVATRVKEYKSVDPEAIFPTVRTEFPPTATATGLKEQLTAALEAQLN